jgi:hypothetical protein
MQTKYRAKYRKMVQLILLGLAFTAIILGACYKADASVVETTYLKVSKTVKTAPAIAFPYYEAYECNPDWSLKYTLFTPIDTRDVIQQLKLQFGLTDVTLHHEDSSWWYYVGTRLIEQPQPTTSTTRTSTVSITSTTISTEEPQGIGGLSLELFIIAVAIVIVLVLLL